MGSTRRLLIASLAVLLLAVGAVPAAAKLEDKEFAKAKRDLDQALAQNNTDGIIAAVKTLGEDQTKRSVDLLMALGARLDDIKVYEAVRAALSGITDEEAVQYMVDTLKKRSDPQSWNLRCVLCECLGGVKGDGVTDAIAKALDDKIPYVTSAAAKALGKRKDAAAIPALINKLRALEKNKDIVWVDVKQALTELTGYDFASASDWDGFWKAKGASFDPSKDRGDKKDATTTLRPGEESVEFFNEKMLAKRIMFVLDVSGSMRTPDIPVDGKGMKPRIQVVKDELVNTIKRLKSDVRFNIISFSGKYGDRGRTLEPVNYWQKVGASASALAKADPGAKADAIKWVQAMKPEGETLTDLALKKAFEPVEVNQICLLSDGEPARFIPKENREVPIPTGEILDMVKGLNRLRGVKINTFCFAVFEGQPGAAPLLQFMEDLATQNGGKLVLCGGGGKKRPKPEPKADPKPEPPKPDPKVPPDPKKDPPTTSCRS